MRARYDVAIVGSGPVGQTLAILLGQRGWTVGVFEKQPAAYPLPRAVHFDHEIGRILQAAGVADEIAGMTEPADVYEWRNAAGETLLRFASKVLGASGWPESNMFAQPELERLLDARAQSLPSVEVHRGHEVVALDGDGATLVVATADGRRHEVAARFVVGCGFTLLSPCGDPAAHLDPAAAAFFATLGGVAAQVGPDGPVVDVDGVYARWFAEKGVDVVLQRSDFYVFGTAARVADAGTLVSALRATFARMV